MRAKPAMLSKTLLGLNNWLLVWAGLGILVSAYALYIETKFEMNPEYVAACDINSIISCTKVLDSRFASGFGLVAPILGEESILNQKNAFYGLLVYFLLSILSRFSSHSTIRLNLYIVYGITIGSIYLSLHNSSVSSCNLSCLLFHLLCQWSSDRQCSKKNVHCGSNEYIRQ